MCHENSTCLNEGSSEYKMRQSFWVPQPCFDPIVLLYGFNYRLKN